MSQVDDLKAENTKLRRLVEITTDLENEDPGCLACAKRQDEEAVKVGSTNPWDFANEAYWQYMIENRINDLVLEYNKLHDEVFGR